MKQANQITKEKTPSGESVSIEPIVQQQNTIVNFNVESLMAKAIEQGLSPETMEKFLAMRQQLKAEWAKEQFDAAMANFQAECPTIEKNKKVSFKTQTGTTNYNYAPLEVIVEQVKHLLSGNGFSYTFDTEETEKGVTIFCFVKHTAGHMEKSKCFIAIDNNSKMNVSQKSGSAMTYGKRYAFCNAFGILTGDEDTDANDVSQDYAKPKNLIKPLPVTLELSEKGKLFKHDLENCNTIEEFKQIKGALSFARGGGKLTIYDMQVLKEIFTKVESEIMPKE